MCVGVRARAQRGGVAGGEAAGGRAVQGGGQVPGHAAPGAAGGAVRDEAGAIRFKLTSRFQ